MELEKKVEVNERILDAAECLFAEQGFESASMRKITERAGVNLASVNYYFGSKDELIMSVLRRIIDPINAKRLAVLRKAREDVGQGVSLPVEIIIKAFLHPLLLRSRVGEEPNMPFFQIVGRCITAPNQLQKKMYEDFFYDMAEEFISALHDSLPELSEKEVRLRFQFMVCLMLGVLVRMPHLLSNASSGDAEVDVDYIIKDLCVFATAGVVSRSS